MSNKSPGFIDGLEKGITVYDAFGQIRTEATPVVRDLISMGGIDGTITDDFTFDVTGLPLTVRRSVSRSTETALIFASLKTRPHHLLRTTTGNGTDALAGFRNHEDGGDFSLIKHEAGFVICFLGSTGINGSGQRGPVGRSQLDFGKEVHRLKGEDRDRFDWVAGGVYRGLQAVRDVKAGKDLSKVLKAAGRDIHK